MWWPTNQECQGCVHSHSLSLQELQSLGMFQNVFYENQIGAVGYDPDESPLLYHASKCKLNIVLGALGTGKYECTLRTE